MFAEAPLLPTSFFPLLQLRTQLAPLEIIAGSEILRREKLLSADDGGNHTHRATDDDANNGSPSARGAPKHSSNALLVQVWKENKVVPQMALYCAQIDVIDFNLSCSLHRPRSLISPARILIPLPLPSYQSL